MPITVNKTACAALVDSGNVYRTVISEEFAKKLRLGSKDIRALPSEHVHTAQKDGKLEVIGETKQPLTLTFYPRGDKSGVRFSITPVVIRDLGMHVNLSGPFLKYHGIDQLHSQDALRLPDGRLIKLLPLEAGALEPEPAELSVVLPRQVRIPPLSIAHIEVPVGRGIALQEGMITGNGKLLDRHKVVPWVAAVVRADDHGRVPMGILNPNDEAIYLPKGLRCATYRAICSPDENAVFPWRTTVHVSSMSTGVTKKPTVQEKISKIIELMKQKKENPKAAEEEEQTKLPTSEEEKKKWLCENFGLTQNPILTTSTQPLLSRAVMPLMKFWDAISINGEYGNTTLVEHRIDTGDCAPIKCKARPINPYLEEDLKKQIEANLAKGVIEPSQSPWSFPVVAAPKKNNKIRWCQDYRRLNMHTKMDTYPLPSIEDNLARLAGSAVFST